MHGSRVERRWLSLSTAWYVLLVGALALTSFRMYRRFDSIADNLVANFLWTVAIVILVTAGSKLWDYFRREGILRFFGLNEHTKAVIYLSNMLIKAQGTTALEEITNGYRGAAISNIEYQAALEIRRLLAEQRIVIAPAGLHRLVGQLLNIVEPQVDIRVSPGKGEHLDLRGNETIISFGSNIYNSVTRHYLNQYFAHDHYKFYDAYPQMDRTAGTLERRIRWTMKNHPTPWNDEANKDPEPAFVIRFKDRDHDGRTVIICAGIRAEATVASTKYLVRDWNKLPRDDDFGTRLFWRHPEQGGRPPPQSLFNDILQIDPAAPHPGETDIRLKYSAGGSTV